MVCFTIPFTAPFILGSINGPITILKGQTSIKIGLRKVQAKQTYEHITNERPLSSPRHLRPFEFRVDGS